MPVNVLGRLAGSMLRDNLVRNGVDLVIDNTLAYFDVANRRLGINTITPTADLDVNGVLKTSSLNTYNLSANAAALINATTGNLTIQNSFVLPVGSNSNYPAANLGSIRYNTDKSYLEYYDGSSWSALARTGGTSEQIFTDSFLGDNNTTNFVLAQNSTTNGSFVAVNGVMQHPGITYTVTGNVLTFLSEPPADTDVVEVRTLTVSSQVGKLQSGSTSFYIDYTSGSGAIKTVVDNVLAMATDSRNTVLYGNASLRSALISNNPAVNVGQSLTVIDSFAANTYRSAKYTVTSSSAGNYQIIEALIIQDGSSANLQILGSGIAGANNISLSSSLVAGIVNLKAISSASDTSVRVHRLYFPV